MFTRLFFFSCRHVTGNHFLLILQKASQLKFVAQAMQPRNGLLSHGPGIRTFDLEILLLLPYRLLKAHILRVQKRAAFFFFKVLEWFIPYSGSC